MRKKAIALRGTDMSLRRGHVYGSRLKVFKLKRKLKGNAAGNVCSGDTISSTAAIHPKAFVLGSARRTSWPGIASAWNRETTSGPGQHDLQPGPGDQQYQLKAIRQNKARATMGDGTRWSWIRPIIPRPEKRPTMPSARMGRSRQRRDGCHGRRDNRRPREKTHRDNYAANQNIQAEFMELSSLSPGVLLGMDILSQLNLQIFLNGI